MISGTFFGIPKAESTPMPSATTTAPEQSRPTDETMKRCSCCGSPRDRQAEAANAGTIEDPVTFKEVEDLEEREIIGAVLPYGKYQIGTGCVVWILTQDEDGAFTVRFPLQTIAPVGGHHNQLRHEKLIRNAPEADCDYVVLQNDLTYMLVSSTDLTVPRN